MVTTAVLFAQEPDRTIPQVRPLPPIAEELLRPLKGEVRTVVRGLKFTVADEFTFTFPHAEIVGDPATYGSDAVHLSLVHLRSPSLFSVSTGKPLVIDLFAELPGPRLMIDRVLIEDMEAGDIYPPGHVPQWFWRLHDIDLDIRSIALGGAGAEGMRVTRADFFGEFRGDPVTVSSLQASLRRAGGEFTGTAAVALRETRLRANGTAYKAGPYTVDVLADPVHFGEVRSFAGMLPKTGTGVVDVGVRGTGRTIDASIRRAVALIGESRVNARGRVRTGSGGTVNDFVVDIPRLRSVDLDAAYGFELPGGGEWRGAVRADGGMRSGINVDGALQQDAASGGGRFAIDGVVHADPSVVLDLRVDADPLRVADTAFVAGLRLSGPIDTLRIRGDVALANGASASDSDAIEDMTATLDANMLKTSAGRFVRGGAELHASLRAAAGDSAVHLRANANGSVALSKGGAVDVDVRADSVPVEALPLPAAFDSARGWLMAQVRLGGTLDAVAVDGRIVSDSVFLLRSDSASVHAITNVRVTGVLPEAIARGGVMFSTRSPDGMRITHAGSAEGSVVLADSGAINVTVRADSLPFRLIPAPAEVEDIRGYARGTARVTGTIAEPRYDGVLHVADGGLRVVRTGTQLAGVHGPIHIRDGVVTIDSMFGDVGGGLFALRGRATLGGGTSSMDFTATIDSGWVAKTDSVSIRASAELHALGTLGAPKLEGGVVLHEGVMHEDVLKRRKPLDVADPPYAELVARVPWLEDSKLRRKQEVARVDGATASLDARIHIDIHPRFTIVDEDSEMFGTGRIAITMDSAGSRAAGIYRIEGGQYNNFGERFDVVGGSFYFDGESMAPHVSMRAEHGHEAPIGTTIGSNGQIQDFFPPLEFFAIGGLTDFTEEVRRLSLVPERQTELGALLIYGEPVQPVTGFRMNRLWQPDDGSDVVGERAEAQSVPLLWAYTADEGYDYIPLSSGYLRAGNYAVGPRYPGRTVAGGLISGGIRFDAFDVNVTHAVEGGALPGVRLRFERDAWRLSAFNEPRFRAQPALGQMRPGHTDVRRTGLRLRWSSDR